MPFWVLAMNITWERIYSISELSSGLMAVQEIVNLIWVFLDIIILVIFFKYGKKEWQADHLHTQNWMFYA